jgi:hypothetical protein
MTNGILRFNTNAPVEVALRWDDGKRVEGRYGEQIMYTLDDQRVMYVPPVVAKQIKELGIRANQMFEICKAELREENKRWIEWHVTIGFGKRPRTRPERSIAPSVEPPRRKTLTPHRPDDVRVRSHCPSGSCATWSRSQGTSLSKANCFVS